MSSACDAIKPDQLAQLDLDCLRSAGNGAEPINPRVLDAFYRAFAPCGFRWEAFCPAYGLAETTLMVSCCSPSLTPRVGRFRADALGPESGRRRRPDDGPGPREVVSCGRIVAEFDVAIVNPETMARCAADQVGEIWVSRPERGSGLLAARRRDRDHVSRLPGRHGGRARSFAPATWASSATASSLSPAASKT